MATTIDNLRVDHQVTIRRDFTDAKGITLRAGESGVIRGISFDDIRLEIYIAIERKSGKVALVFAVKAPSGPRIGHMREFFELGDYVPVPGTEPRRYDPAARTMIVPPQKTSPPSSGGSDWWRAAQNTEGPDRLEAVEQEMLRSTDQLGVSASVAEMYAQRMRAFQRAGNEPRAIAAFKLAVSWMATNASQATSGGEGAALSYERDQFHAALVREFGYDPTDDKV